MAVWKITASILALVLCSSTANADWSIKDMNEQIEKTNVIVGGVCSGTIIDKEKRIVLTAFHCINDQVVEEEVKEVDPETGEIRIKKIQKRKPLAITVNKIVDYEIVSSMDYTVKIFGIDDLNDIAVLQVIDEDFNPSMEAKLASDDFKLKRGMKIYAVGNPGVVYDNSITEGIISAPQRTVEIGGKSYKFFQHSASIMGGNSGGSILNENGELIGTISAGLRGVNISFAVPISFTKNLLKKIGLPEVAQ